MPRFLNTEGILHETLQLIANAKQDLIFIVPYIRISERVYTSLKEAVARGIEITVVFREIKEDQDQLLKALPTVNLLQHPDVHAKACLNESAAVISSMNLYDYSERNNREMGVLLEDNPLVNNDAYDDAMREAAIIIRGAHIVHKGQRAAEAGLKLRILESLKATRNLMQQLCDSINAISDNKDFIVRETSHRRYEVVCEGYRNRMDVFLDCDMTDVTGGGVAPKIRRASICLHFDEPIRKMVWERFGRGNEGRYPGYMVYWDYHLKSPTVYLSRKHPSIKSDGTPLEDYKALRPGIELLLQKLQEIHAPLKGLKTTSPKFL